jgi:hypothetical protein
MVNVPVVLAACVAIPPWVEEPAYLVSAFKAFTSVCVIVTAVEPSKVLVAEVPVKLIAALVLSATV